MKRPSRRACALASLFALAACTCAAVAAADGPPSSDNEGQGLINLGNSFTDRGDYQSAEIAYERILGGGAFSVSDRQAALLGLGRTFRKSGNLTKAAALYERFIKDYPTDDRLPDAYLELGRTLRAMGANKLALNRFYSVINSTLKLPQTGFEHYQSLARTAEYEIAETFYEDGDYGRASAYFSRLQLLSLSPADRARASFMAARSAILAEDLENGCRPFWKTGRRIPTLPKRATSLRRPFARSVGRRRPLPWFWICFDRSSTVPMVTQRFGSTGRGAQEISSQTTSSRAATP